MINIISADDIENGVVVTKVKPRGEAAEKGLGAGDVIVEINQKSIEKLKRFRNNHQQSKESKETFRPSSCKP